MNAPHTLFPQVPAIPHRPAMGQSHARKRPRPGGGRRAYIDDLPEVKGTLYAAPILSTVAHGR
jgi:xanthine dehydrogenase large subunit